MQSNTRTYRPAAHTAAIDAAELWRQALRGDAQARDTLVRQMMPAKRGRTTALRSRRQA